MQTRGPGILSSVVDMAVVGLDYSYLDFLKMKDIGMLSTLTPPKSWRSQFKYHMPVVFLH